MPYLLMVQTSESNGTDTLNYFYDEKGMLIYFTLNDVPYYYVRNGQNDIVGILDNDGNEVVNYRYDTWGKLLEIGGSLASTVGVKNPYRYRGYRYDTETGLYYLQSRYYNPEMGRFINADGLVDSGRLFGHNMFAYCGNDPVNIVDPSGCIPEWVWALAGGAAVADGPLPVGDIIAVGIIGIAFIASLAAPKPDTAPPLTEIIPFPSQPQSPKNDKKFGPDIIGEPRIKTPKKEDDKKRGNLYYHAMDEQSALSIATGKIKAGEFGYVYAWKRMPDSKAVYLSGARGNVVISFRINASFERDTWVYNEYAQKFDPVRTTRPGDIRVWDVRVVRY